MDHPTKFNGGLELGNFIVGSGLLNYSWSKIVDLQNENQSNDTNLPPSVRHKVYHHNKFGTIIVFVSSPLCTTQHVHKDMVSLENLKLKVPNFEFNKAAVDLYASIQNELSSLIQYVNIRPLIISGNSMGGSIASLFTLWLLENTSPKPNKCPLCITFGSPFLGDSNFQWAISERPTWNSSFLNIISTHDPIPYQLSSIYKPFGTFLLCSDSSCALFAEPGSVLDLMKRMSNLANFGSNELLQVFDYGNVLDKLSLGTIIRGVSELGERDFSPLQAGIVIQIRAIAERARVCGNIDSTIEAIEKRMIGLWDRKRKVFDPQRKLNDVKIHMTYVEWYKKATESSGGYYDSFKNTQSRMREKIVEEKNKLMQYWLKSVREAAKMPKNEDVFFGMAWLYAGTNYRRLVEPLDIAEWYRKGKTDYLATRSEHYKLLEKWVKDDQNYKNVGKLRACSLTLDSCFWAHVEESLIKCKLLSGSGGGSVENREMLMEDLVRFESYVMGLIENNAVSSEIFLNQSSFMKWWENYEKIVGDNYHSSLSNYMNNQLYKKYP